MLDEGALGRLLQQGNIAHRVHTVPDTGEDDELDAGGPRAPGPGEAAGNIRVDEAFNEQYIGGVLTLHAQALARIGPKPRTYAAEPKRLMGTEPELATVDRTRRRARSV